MVQELFVAIRIWESQFRYRCQSLHDLLYYLAERAKTRDVLNARKNTT